jgi:hypothetical protein
MLALSPISTASGPSLRRAASRTKVVPVNAVTLFGVLAVSFMMVMYALEQRHPVFILAFAAGCLLSSAYGFLSGAWPFGVVELIWSGVAVRRYLTRRPLSPGVIDGGQAS